jgi:uncharacterized membrane protein YoaK (UPF0700 family)
MGRSESDNSSLKNARLLAWVLAVTGGFVDTAGFLGLDGLFCSHITGNLVLAGTRLAVLDTEDALVRLIMLPVFVLATAATMLFIRRRSQRGHHVLSACLLLEGVVLALFMGVCMYLIPDAGQEITDRVQMVTGCLGVVAMAVQNTMMRELLPQLAPTTVMTGNITGGVSDAVRLLWGEKSPALRQRAKRVSVSLGGFMLGCVLAAVLMQTVGFACLLGPVVCVTCAALYELRTHRLSRLGVDMTSARWQQRLEEVF